MRSRKTLFALSLILTFAAITLSSAAIFAAPPKNISHPCDVTVGDRPGDSILSYNGNTYSNGTTAEARLWDMVNGVADHLYFQVDPRRHQGRKIRLSIPTIAEFAGGPQDCQTATFKPNQNDDYYQFYNALPIGKTTDDPDIQENFKGDITCLDSRGRNGWIVTYQTQCIVIAHTGVGAWTVTADGGVDGCPAAVSKVTNGAVTAQGNHDVPFQLQATEFP